jgi:hypothetical protein
MLILRAQYLTALPRAASVSLKAPIPWYLVIASCLGFPYDHSLPLSPFVPPLW